MRGEGVTNLERFALSCARCRHCGYFHSDHQRLVSKPRRCPKGTGFFESEAEHPGARKRPVRIAVAEALRETRARVKAMR